MKLHNPKRGHIAPSGPEWGEDLLSANTSESIQRNGTFKSLRYKMIFSLLVIYLLGSLTALMALYSLSYVQEKTLLIEAFYELNQQILEIRRYEKNYLLYGNVTDLMNAFDYLEKAQASLEQFKINHSIPDVAADRLPEAISQLTVFDEMLHNLVRSDIDQRTKKSSYGRIRHQGHLITQTILLMDNQARMAMEISAQKSRNIALFLLASTMILGAVLSVLFARWVIEPLDYIKKAVRRIMLGELTEIPITPRMEQFGECKDMIFSLNKLLDALKFKQEQLVQSTKLAVIGEVTAGIAHEINNPLNNIFLTAEVVLDELSESTQEEQAEMINDIVEQADRAREVVKNLLDFSKVHKPAKWKHFNVADLLNETLVLLKNQITLDQIDVVKEYDTSADVQILGHRNLIQQVFVNIILNAIQSAGRNGVITLSLNNKPTEVVVTVKDNGPGIPDHIQPHIFDPFFTTKDSGTGLGLSVCYAIIKEHNGDITLTSAKDQGASFKIYLPADNKMNPTLLE